MCQQRLSYLTSEKKEYKIYHDDGCEVFDVSLEECMSTTVCTEYNPQLAHMLIALNNAVYDAKYINDSLSNLGFQDRQRISTPFITYNIGRKQLAEGTVLILIVVRGSGDVRDIQNLFNWGSNFHILPNSSKYHTGFSDAANSIYRSIKEMLGGADFSNVKFVITGHSRGAAAANLLEVNLREKGFPKKNIYGYNFACPDTAMGDKDRWNPFGRYDNIFNINLASDPYSMLPRVLGSPLAKFFLHASWGKFGRSRWYARDWNDFSEIAVDFFKHNQKVYLRNFRCEPFFRSFKTWEKRKQTITDTQIKSIKKWLHI